MGKVMVKTKSRSKKNFVINSEKLGLSTSKTRNIKFKFAKISCIAGTSTNKSAQTMFGWGFKNARDMDCELLIYDTDPKFDFRHGKRKVRHSDKALIIFTDLVGIADMSSHIEVGSEKLHDEFAYMENGNCKFVGNLERIGPALSVKKLICNSEFGSIFPLEVVDYWGVI